MVPKRGIEPRTQGFSVPCSTDWAIWAKLMAEVTRLELATSCVTGKHSNQLSYTSTYGGHNWARTNDPLLVRQVLSQLSYATTLTSIVYNKKKLLSTKKYFVGNNLRKNHISGKIKSKKHFYETIIMEGLIWNIILKNW